MRKAVSGGVATKGDVDELKAELKGDVDEVRGEIRELRAELKGDIGEVRGEVATVKAELKGDIGEVRGEVGEVRGEIGAVKAELWAFRWMMGLMLAILLAVAARLFGVVQAPPGFPSAVSHARSSGASPARKIFRMKRLTGGGGLCKIRRGALGIRRCEDA